MQNHNKYEKVKHMAALVRHPVSSSIETSCLFTAAPSNLCTHFDSALEQLPQCKLEASRADIDCKPFWDSPASSLVIKSHSRALSLNTSLKHARLAVFDCSILTDSYTTMKQQIRLLQIIADRF